MYNNNVMYNFETLQVHLVNKVYFIYDSYNTNHRVIEPTLISF